MRAVLATGVWDVLHVGHLHHLEAARKLGDRLVVGVTADEHVNKGPGRPVFAQRDRRLMVQALRCVDYAFITPSSCAALDAVRPAVFALGSEYRDKVLPEDREFCELHGIGIEFTSEPTYSSTALLHFYDRLRQDQAA